MLQPEVFHELSHCQCVYMNVYAAVTALDCFTQNLPRSVSLPSSETEFQNNDR